MLVSMMFYNANLRVPTYPQKENQIIDVKKILKSLSIGIQSSLIVALLTLPPIKIFKKSPTKSDQRQIKLKHRLKTRDQSTQASSDEPLRFSDDFLFENNVGTTTKLQSTASKNVKNKNAYTSVKEKGIEEMEQYLVFLN